MSRERDIAVHAPVAHPLPRPTSLRVRSRRVPSCQRTPPSCRNRNGFGRFELFLREKRWRPQQGSNLRPWLSKKHSPGPPPPPPPPPPPQPPPPPPPTPSPRTHPPPPPPF